MATIKNAIDPQLQADLPRLDIVPTSSPTPLTISVVERNNGTRDITVTWDYTQSRIEATHIGLLWNVNPSSAPAAPTVSNNSGSVILPISQTSYTFEGVHPEQYYRLGIVAGKQVESTWSTTAVVSPTTSPNWQVSKGTSNNTNNINGVLASDITAAMVNFNTSNDQNANAISAPTGLALTQTLNSVGSVDLTLSWDWTGNEFDIDGFGIYVHADSASTSYTLGNSSDTVYPTLPSLRSFTAFGVAQNQYYTIGVRAYRVVDTNVNASGFILSTITQLAAVRPNGTPNITANVGGQTSTAIANTVTGLSDLNNNGKLTPNEKQELLRKFNEILQYKPGLISQANSFSITTELSTYTAKFQALADYLNNGSTWTSGDPFLLNSTNILATSDVTGITLDTKILEYINAFEALNQKIASVAATKATYTNVTGTPTTLAEVNSADGAKLAGIQAEATKGSPAGTLINGVLAETVQSYASNSFTGTAKYRATGGPTNNPTPTGSTVTANTVGGRDIRLDWSAYSQGANQADLLYLFFKEGSGTPTIADASVAFNVNTSSGSYYIFQNVDATKAYTAGIAAGRRTENGIEFGSIVTHATWAISAGSANNAATSVGGQTAANVASTVTDTSTFRTSGAPTNQPTLSTAIVSAITAGGTVDIRLPFTYTQGALPADEFICYFVEGATAPTTSSAVAGKVSKNDREFFFQGVPADKNYRAGIVASRNTSSGPISGSIVTGWSYTAQTVTLDAGKLAGVTASVINTNITNAQNTANTAIANAANAQNSATTVNGLVADMYSDGKLTPEEKINLRRLFNEAVAGKSAIISQATGFGITTELTAFNTKFQALADYLNNGTTWASGDPFWLNSTNIGITHDVVGVTLDSKINEFLVAQTALFQKVADVAATKANWGSGTIANLPTPLAEITNSDAIKNSLLRIGGTNFIRNSGNFFSLAFWRTAGGVGSFVVDTAVKYAGRNTLKFISTPSTADYLLHDNTYRIKANTIYTISAVVLSSVSLPPGFKSTLHPHCWTVELPGSAHQDVNISNNNAVTQGVWTKIYATFSTPVSSEDCFFRLQFYPLNYPNGIVFNIASLQLEEGNVATDWTPCPLDVDEGISEAAKTAIWDSNKLSGMPTSIAAVNSSDKIKNSEITVDDAGKLLNIGTANITVDNTKQLFNQIADRPTDLATLNNSDGTKLAGIQAGATVGADFNSNLSNIPPTIYNTGDATGGYYINPSFENWTGTFPDQWQENWGGTSIIKETSIKLVGKNAVRFNCNGGNVGIYCAKSFPPISKDFIISGSVSIYLESRVSGLPSFYLSSWTAGYASIISLGYVQPASTVTGSWQRVNFVLRGNGIDQPQIFTFTLVGSNSSSGAEKAFVGNVIFDNLDFTVYDGAVFDNARQQYDQVLGKPANIASLVGTELLKNSDITFDSDGRLVNIGTPNVVADNTKIAINGSGQLTGIGAGNNTPVSNSLISVDNDGNLINIGNISPVSVGNNVNGLIRNPSGGTFKTTTTSFTGALKITLPVYFTNTMLKFTVDIFEYSTGLSCTLSIAGYNEASGVWYNVTASVIGGNTEYPVYFGHDGSKCVIWIGDTTETWSYPQVQLTNAMFSFTNYTKGMWESGWVISFSSSARTNVTATVLDTYLPADWSKSSKRPANLAALTGSEGIKNELITVNNTTGEMAGIGTSGIQVDNTKQIFSQIGGQISNTQITDNTISALKILNGTLTAAKTAIAAIDPNSGNLTANSVTTNTIAAGAITAAKIAAGSITANEISSGYVNSIVINASQINSGTFTSHTVDTSGYGRFRGGISVGGYQAAIVANDTVTQYTGIFSQGSTHGMIGGSSATYGSGVYGINTGSGSGVQGYSNNGIGVSGNSIYSPGVQGGSTSSYGGSFSSSSNHGVYGTTSSGSYAGVAGQATSGYGVYGIATTGNAIAGSTTSGACLVGVSSSGKGAYGVSTSSYGVHGVSSGSYGGVFESTSGYGLYASSASGNAIFCNGALTITSTNLVSNLNAEKLNGVGTDGYLRYFTTNSGSASVAGGYINIVSNVSGYQFQGFANQVSLNAVSDSRLKEDIWPEIFGKDFIKQLKPVSYRYKNNNKLRHHGFIANNMVEFTGDFNDSLSLYDPQRDIYGTDYMSYISPIVKAMQEDFSELDQTKQELTNVKQELEDLKTLIQQLLNQNQN